MRFRPAVAVCCLAVAARAGSVPPDPLPRDAWAPALQGRTAFRVYTDRDGLPQNAITSLAWDRHHILWVGTKDGPAFGNGRTFTPFALPNRQASAQVSTILSTRDGSLWFGTDGGGLVRLKDGRMTVHDRRGGLAGDRVQCLLEDAGGSGVVWAGTSEGLSRWDGRAWSTAYPGDGAETRMRSLFQSELGPRADLLVGTRSGLVRQLGGRYVPDPGLPRAGVNAFLEAASEGGGRILLCGTDAGLFEWAGEAWRRPEGAPWIASQVVFALLETRAADGSPVLWVGTVYGLARREKGRWTVEGTDLNSPLRGIWSLLAGESPSDPVWIGTSGNGLLRVRSGVWRYLDRSDGLPTSSVYALLEGSSPSGPSSPARSLWVGTAAGGVARVDETGVKTYPEVEAARALLETPGPTVWAGTVNGLYRFDGGAWERVDREAGIHQNVRCLLGSTLSDGSTVVWVGTLGGVARLQDGRWSVLDRGSGLPDETIRCLAETAEEGGARSLWMGTDVGVVRLKEGVVTAEGADAGLPNLQVTCLKESRAGGHRRLWAGTIGGGAAYRELDGAAGRKPSWVTLSDATTPALPNNTVYRIEEDARGRLYLFTNKGVARLTPDGRGSFSVFTFTTEDGLPSNECNTGASMVDSLGRLWAGTIGGAAVFDPAAEFEDRTRKPLRVERVRVAGRDVTGAGQLDLAFDDRPISIDYVLLSYVREGDTRYRTRLVGLDASPTPWNDAHEKVYEYLPAGSYTFQLWGRDYAGNETGPLELSLRVRPAPWRTPWAYASYVLVVLTAVWGGLRLRDRTLRRIAERLQAMVRERTAELDQKTRQLGERTAELERANQSLARANEDLERANRDMQRLAAHDGLTGVFNRRSFDQALEAHWGLARRSGEPISALMVDIDRFKDLNDRLGHQAGDDCLRGVAQTLSRGLGRATDLLARYGGEEFVVLLPGTTEAGAALVGERLRRDVEAFGVGWVAGRGAPPTVSVGVASTNPPSGVPAEWLISLADQALYTAKRLGRNRVVVAGREGAAPDASPSAS